MGKLLNQYFPENTEPTLPDPPKRGVLNRVARSADIPSTDPLLGTTELQHYGQDISNDDYLDADYTWQSPFDTKELRAQRQPWLHKAGAMAGRVGVKVAAEIAKMPGVIGGAIAAPFAEEGEGWETVVNNSWIKAINNANEYINDEAMPVYVRKAVEEGKLWDNISSIDFWATEGADGIGYIASMMAPGAILKGLRVGNMIARNPLLRGTVSSTKADVVTATLANTLFEASAEAGGAMDNMDKQRHKIIQEYMKQGNTLEQANKLFDDQKSKLGRDIFIANAAILTLPNALQSQMLWGRTAKKGVGKLFDKNGDLLKNIANPSKWTYAGKRAKNVLGATASEGFLEEAGQMTAEHMFTARAEEGELTDNYFYDFNLSDIGKYYADTVSSTEGQKAMFLGAFLGGGMSAYHGHKGDAAQQKSLQNLLNKGNNAIDAYYNILTRNKFNEDGSVDIESVFNKIASADLTDMLSAKYNAALGNNDTDALEKLRELAATQLAYGFIMDDELGLEVLEEYLNNTTKLQEIAFSEKQAGNNISTAEIKEKVMDKARFLEKHYSKYNEFAPALMSPAMEEMDEATAEGFSSKMRQNYMNNKSQIKMAQDSLKSLQGKLEYLEENFDEDTPPIESIDDIKSKIAQVERNIKRLKKIESNFWNKKVLAKNAKRYQKEREALAKEQEKTAKYDKFLEELDQVTTKEELEALAKKYSGEMSDPDISKAFKEAEKNLENFKKPTKKEEEPPSPPSPPTPPSAPTKKTTEEKEEKEEEEEKEYVSEFEPGTTEETPPTPPVETKETKETEEEEEFVSAEAPDTNVTPTPEETEEAEFISAEDPLENGNPVIAEAVGEVASNLQKEADEKSEKETKEQAEAKQEELEEEYTSAEQPSSVVPEQTEGQRVLPKTDSGAHVNNSSKNNVSPMGVNKKTNEPIFPGLQEWVDMERTPTDKTGKKVTFSIQKKNGDDILTLTENNKKAVNLLASSITGNKELTEAERNFVIDYLPIVVHYEGSDNIKSTIGGRPSNDFKGLYENKDRILRENIVKGLLAGYNISDMYTEIDAQMPGDIIQDELDENGRVAENPIDGLYDIQILPEKKRLGYIYDNLFYIDDLGNARYVKDGGRVSKLIFNREGEKYRTSSGMYHLVVRNNQGVEVPMKLNHKYVEENKAEALYQYYMFRMNLQGDPNVNKAMTLGDLKVKDAKLYNLMMKELSDEIETISEIKVTGRDNISLKDVIDILIYDNSDSPKSRVKLDKNNLLVGEHTMGKAKLNSKVGKQIFMDFLTKQKRRHIIAPTKGLKGKALNVSNIHYLDYIVRNGILNTDAPTGLDENGNAKPTFQGNTSVYIKSSIKLQNNPESTRKFKNNSVSSQEESKTEKVKKKVEKIKKEKETKIKKTLSQVELPADLDAYIESIESNDQLVDLFIQLNADQSSANFRNYLTRLKEIDESAYNKEMNKICKG